MKTYKKIFVGYVPRHKNGRAERMIESMEFWNTKTIGMFSLKTLKELQIKFPDERHVKRTATVTVEEEDID